MRKDLRAMIELGRGAGLTFLDTEPGAKHTRVRFTNEQGDILVMHANGGTSARCGDRMALLNIRAELRRFARGAYEGLYVEKVQHV